MGSVTKTLGTKIKNSLKRMRLEDNSISKLNLDKEPIPGTERARAFGKMYFGKYKGYSVN